jgi:predicted nucleic acid-binding Zn ribbon protein
MPMYDFRCVETGEVKSLFWLVEDLDELKEWFTEDGKTWKRVYTAPAIHFHGSGFYSNGG